MNALTISLITLTVLALLLRSWLAAHELAYIIPVIFTFVLAAAYVLPFFDFDRILHWYDQVLAIVVFVYEWAIFLISDQKNNA